MSLLDSLPPGAAPATDVVSTKVSINGTVLSNEISLSQVIINKTFNKIASAKLVFIDGSVSDQDFALSDDDKFKPGNTIEVELGYEGDTDTVFKGIIIKHAIKIRKDGSGLLLIEAKDSAVKLTTTRKSAYYLKKKDKDIISSIATGFNPDVDTTTVEHEQLVQFDTTDWDFIVTRAEANSMLVLTDDGTISVKKPVTTGDPVVTASYGQNIWEFEAEMDARRQIADVTSHSWDYTKQQLEDSSSGTATFSENGNLSSDDLGSVLATNLYLAHSGYLKKDQLQTWSDAYAMRNHLSKAAGRVKLDGNADIKPGTLIKLDGVGDRFNGNVFVTGILHHYDGYWFTEVQFGWRDEWFYKKEDVMDKPAGGLLPGINGIHTGIVTNVSDSSSGGQYRVQVCVNAYNKSTADGIWARVASLDAGNNRGAFFRPQKGDEVVLGFLNADPREAIILGYLHSKDNKTAPFNDGDLKYGFVTDQKLTLSFDDKNKIMTLSVPAGQDAKSIVIDSKAGSIEMKDENKNSIKMNSSGITIDAGTNNVTIKGAKVMIN